MKQRILITGGAGFVGTHLAEAALHSGSEVRILDCFSTQVHGTTTELDAAIRDDVELIRGDVRSADDVRRALSDVDVVYHLAASVGVGQSMYEIHSYVDNNNTGTANLLQQMMKAQVEKLIVASSMSLYGEGAYLDADGRTRVDIGRDLDAVKARRWDPVDEAGRALRPIPTDERKTPDLSSIYALSKFDQERMCLLFGKAYQIPTVALRFFNIFGRGQALSNPYTGVLAIFASRLLNNAAPILFEDGNQLRDFVHVSDVVRACLLAAENPSAVGQAFNVASGSQRTVREVARAISKAMGKEHIAPLITGEYRVGDVRHCVADVTRAREVMGFAAKVGFEDGIADLVEWLAEQRAIDRSAEMRRELASRGLAI